MSANGLDQTNELFEDPKFSIEVQMEKATEILKLHPQRREYKAIGLLSKVMLNISFFKNVYEEYGEETLTRICKNMLYQVKPAFSIVFKQGDRGQQFFILLRGKCSVNMTLQKTIEKPDGTVEKEFYLNEIAEKVTGDSFGELALIDDKPRTATIICKEECHFAILERDYYKEILAKAQQEKIDEKINFLMEFPLFSQTSRRGLSTFIYHFHQKKYNMNEWVYKQGEESEYIYFVKEGEFTITKDVNTAELLDLEVSESQLLRKKLPKQTISIGNLQSGQIIGIEDVVEDRKRTESVRCVSNNSLVYHIKKQDFQKRFYGATNDDVAQNIKSYVRAREDWRNKRQNSIKMISQSNRDFMFSQAIQANKKLQTSWNNPSKITGNDQEEGMSPGPTKSETLNNARGRITIEQESMKLPATLNKEGKHSFSPTDNSKNTETRAISLTKPAESKILTDSNAFVTEVSGLYNVDTKKQNPSPSLKESLGKIKFKEPKQEEISDPFLLLGNDTVTVGSLGTTPFNGKKEILDLKRNLFKPLEKLIEDHVFEKNSSILNSQKLPHHHNASFDQPPRPLGYKLFESNIRGINQTQKPKQILQRKMNVQHVNKTPQSLNANKQVNLNKSEEFISGLDLSKKLDREYISFKKGDGEHLSLFGTAEQSMLIESKAQIVARMESSSKSKNIDIIRYFIQKEKEKGILKRKTENVNIDPAFMAKKEQKRKELGGSTVNRFIELEPNESSGQNNNSTLKMLNDTHYRPYFKTGDKEYMMDVMNLSTIYRHKQIGDHTYHEVQMRTPYPMSAIKNIKPSSNTVKQIRMARQQRRLASRGRDDVDEEPPRLHSYKVG